VKTYVLHTAAAILLLVSGCDFFSTREPEPPLNRQSSWLIPLDGQQTLENLQASVYEQHLENFMRSLADTAFSDEPYSFTPDAETGAEYAALFTHWSRQSEEAAMQQVFTLAASTGDVHLVLTPDAEEHPSANLMVWNGRYKLELTHTAESLPSVYEGHVIWHLTPDSRGHWVIVKWFDVAAKNRVSWSRLKAALGG